MRSILSPMFMTLACVIAFTIAQPEILETSSDGDLSEAISSVAGICRFQEAGISEPDSNEADKLLKQICKNEENWATKSLLNLIEMQMRDKITGFLYSTSTEALLGAQSAHPELYRDQTSVIAQVMTIVTKMVKVTIKPNPDSTEKGIQKPKEDSQQIAQLFEELKMLLTKWGLSTDRISSLISLVDGYTSSGKIEPLGLYRNQIISRPDATTDASPGARVPQGVKVKVIRNGGHIWEIPEAELVRDDIILVTEGQIVPADCRVIWSMGLKVDESSLTGVSDHVEKSADGVSKMMPTGCRTYKNLIMKGTTVIGGDALAIVFGTDMNTWKGLIQEQQNEKSKPLPMMNKIRARASRNNKFAF